jgi:hypothetical protein
MSSNEPWRAVQPSASASTGQDPLAEAFKSAVNAFGRPVEWQTTSVVSEILIPRGSILLSICPEIP